ncbi:uncharacterized protein [Cherax quadricarinatus]
MALLSKARGWIIVYVVVWACTLPPSMGYLSEVLRVGINAQFCNQDGATLFCDYKGTRRMVHMDEELDSSVQKVFVHNAVKLQLSESVCINVMLNNVADVVVVRGEGQPCEAHLELLARNSTLDRLPNQVHYVHLENSIFNSLATALSITQLTVINSSIKVLDISSPLQNDVPAKFESSKIDTLEKLHVANGSELILDKSSVDIVSSHGLIIEARVVLRESSINASLEESVVMYPGATLKLDSFSGHLAVKVKSQGPNGRPQVTLPPCISIPDKSYWEEFITCLILLIIAFVFIVTLICILKGKLSLGDWKVKESKKSSKTDLECSLIDGLINTSTQVTLDDISETFAIIPVRNLDDIHSKNTEISTSLLSDKSLCEEELNQFYRKINDLGNGEASNVTHAQTQADYYKTKHCENSKYKNAKEKPLTEIKVAEDEHKKAQEEKHKYEYLVKINTEKKKMREQAGKHIKKYVQKMRESTEQVLDLWNKTIVSFDWNTFMVDPQEWLTFFKCQIKERERCLKVQTERENSTYKTSEKILNQSISEKNEQLKHKLVSDISSIKRDFNERKKGKTGNLKIFKIKTDTCKIKHGVRKEENLNVESQKLKESHENALLSLDENFLQEMRLILESILTMHRLIVLFSIHVKIKRCSEKPEGASAVSSQKLKFNHY